MGLFRSQSGKGRGKPRREPRLFASAPKRAQARAEPRKRARRSLWGRLVVFAATLSIWVALVVGAGFAYVWTSLDQKGLLKIPEREPGVMLLASDGSVLAESGAFYGDEVRIDELPSYVPNAIIAIEDRRFRGHYGVDLVGIARALIENWRAGRVVQGGSTLTQQLAKNLFLSPERAIKRKVQEMVLAVWLERHFSKDEILQIYINRVYFGAGAIGIEKAAQKYFGHSAREASLPEAAILAAVLKAPTNYNPITHPEEAEARAREVIADMVAAGFVSRAEASQAITAPATVKPADYVSANQYITDWIIDGLPELVKAYDRSIVVETTIDPQLQARAEKSLRKRLSTEGAKVAVSQGAFVALDTAGAVKAMIGGKSYAKSQFNRVTKAKRQPGSAFKPFVYLTAIEQGYTPDSVEVDEPVTIGDWSPENYRRKYLGAVSLTKALALSLNTVAAKLAFAVGLEAVAATAHRLGIVSELNANASLALGTSEVTLLELTAAFAPFADGGRPVAPYAVTRITTREGKLLYQRKGSGLGEVVSPHDLGAMNRMLRAVVTRGTGQRAQFGDFEIAGKTGTSQDYRDAWFIGYSSYLIAGVWVGNDDNSPTRKVTGGSLPANIWKDVMEPAHLGLAPLPLPGEAALAANDEGQPPAPRAEEAVPAPKRRPDAGGGFLGNLFGSKREPAKQPPSGGRGKKTSYDELIERLKYR